MLQLSVASVRGLHTGGSRSVFSEELPGNLRDELQMMIVSDHEFNEVL